MNYTLISLPDANDCREVVQSNGLQDGLVLGYVIRQAWRADEEPWTAYERNPWTDSLYYRGRFATPEEAARAVAGEG